MNDSELYEFPEAAEYLRCTERWLRRNSAKFPREKRGRKVLFSRAQLDHIREATTLQPAKQSSAPIGDLMNLRPLPSRRAA